MKFSKTLLAAALFATAGAANAGIAKGNTDATREAYISVYDSVQALTYNLDLGISLAELIANVNNDDYRLTYDLSGDSNWQNFTQNLNAGSTVYSIATGRSDKLVVTLQEPVASPQSPAGSQVSPTAVDNHAGEINVRTGETASENLSTLVSDLDTPQTGQYNNFMDLFGTKSIANASIPFGTEAAFYFIQGTNRANRQFGADDGLGFAGGTGRWLLAGNTLSYTAAAPVPVPAAIWMFGAGLLSMLGFNRRKAVAA